MILINVTIILKNISNFSFYLNRIRFGSNNLFVFIHPVEAEAMKGKIFRDITFEFAQSEIIKHSGLNISDGKNYMYIP